MEEENVFETAGELFAWCRAHEVRQLFTSRSIAPDRYSRVGSYKGCPVMWCQEWGYGEVRDLPDEARDEFEQALGPLCSVPETGTSEESR